MKVLFLSPNYPGEMRQFVRGLSEVGAEVVGLGDHPAPSLDPMVRRALRAYWTVPNIMDEVEVFRVAARLPFRPDRVETNWEPLVRVAARLREHWGLGGHTVDVVEGFRDKSLMRQRVARAGIRVPRSVRVVGWRDVVAAAEHIGFPMIVKPLDGAGSADTHRLGTFADLQSCRPHYEDRAWMVEEMVVGEEWTYEAISVDGRPVYESVSRYLPNALDARQNEWISPIIQTIPLSNPVAQRGMRLGRAALQALSHRTGFTHMEWFLRPDGEAVFGEIACRAPGANMVDLMNYAGDIDLYREWARAVCWGDVWIRERAPFSAAIIFKRAVGTGRIVEHRGLESFVRDHGRHVARVDLVPLGVPRRDWRQTFLSDGNLVVRHPDPGETERLAKKVATEITLYAR